MFMQLLALLLASPVVSPDARAATEPPPCTARFYEIGSERRKLLFTETIRQVGTPDDFKATGIYVYPDGKVAMIEEVEVEKGLLKTYTIQQNQIQQSGSLEVRDGKVWFRYV